MYAIYASFITDGYADAESHAPYYAPDKTSLRRALYGAAKAEMIVAPVRR